MDINSILPTVTNVNVTQVLISATLISLVCFIIVYKWKYRHLEKLAAQLLGTSALPIIGNDLQFLGSLEANHILPAGCQVFVMPAVIHMDPKVFPNPEEFNPENCTRERIADRHKYSCLPFSAGPRACLGMKCFGQTYAMLTVKTSLAYLIPNYRILQISKGKISNGKVTSSLDVSMAFL